MARYIIRRIVHSVLLLLTLTVVVFFATHLLGYPASLMLRPEAGEEQYHKLREELGLTAPLPQQFLRFAGNLVRGDFGDAIWQGVPALPIALERLPKTLYLVAITLLIAVPLAITLGIVSALHPRSLADRLVTVVSLVGASIADFWFGMMLILFFAVQLQWLPTSGFGGLSFVILPAVAL